MLCTLHDCVWALDGAVNQRLPHCETIFLVRMIYFTFKCHCEIVCRATALSFNGTEYTMQLLSLLLFINVNREQLSGQVQVNSCSRAILAISATTYNHTFDEYNITQRTIFASHVDLECWLAYLPISFKHKIAASPVYKKTKTLFLKLKLWQICKD